MCPSITYDRETICAEESAGSKRISGCLWAGGVDVRWFPISPCPNNDAGVGRVASPHFWDVVDIGKGCRGSVPRVSVASIYFFDLVAVALVVQSIVTSSCGHWVKCALDLIPLLVFVLKKKVCGVQLIREIYSLFFY